MAALEEDLDFKKPEGYKNVNFNSLTEKVISYQKK